MQRLTLIDQLIGKNGKWFIRNIYAINSVVYLEDVSITVMGT